MDTGDGSMVGMAPDLADVLVRELRAAEAELKACAAEVGAVLADVGEASFIPAELNQVAAWCAGEAGEVARRASTVRCGPTAPGGPATLAGNPSGFGGGISARGGERLINVAVPRPGEILLTPPAPRLQKTRPTPPTARGRQVLGNPGAPEIPKAPCAPPVRRGALHDLVSNGAGRRSEGVTTPSRGRDRHAAYRGPMATPRPNDDDDNRRGLEAQNWVANKMAEEGYEVEQKKPVSGQKSPDYVVEGRVFDCYAPSTPNVRNIWDKVKAKVIAGQTERVVVSLRDTPVRASQLRRQFEDWPVPGLKEVLVVDDTGAVSRIFP